MTSVHRDYHNPNPRRSRPNPWNPGPKRCTTVSGQSSPQEGRMSHRYLICFSALAAAIALVSLPITGQAPAAKAKAGKAYVPPKTPWGDPDLEGVWPGNMGVPMQRNAKLGERTTLTDEEYQAKQVQAQKQAQADSVSTA